MENDSFGSSSSDPDSMGERHIMMRDIVQNSSSEIGDGSTSISSSSSSEEDEQEEEDGETHRAQHAGVTVSYKADDQTSEAPNFKSGLEKSGGGNGERAKDSGFRGRVWSDEDEIALLQVIRDNQKKTGRQPSEDLTAILASLQGKLSLDMSKSQVYEKIRRLKTKFFNQAGSGKELVSGDNHVSKVFLLSKNIWGSDNNSTEMEEDASDLMVKSVLQELNATGVENSMKQQELNCSTGSIQDDPVSCAREGNIFATKDECPADHNTTSKPKNTLAKQEKESEEQNKEIAEGCSKLRTLDPEVGILQKIGPQDNKAIQARSENNDMSQEGARNQQTEESTLNIGTDLYTHKKKKNKQEIKGDKNIEDLHAKLSQKSTSSNVNFIIEELAADEPNRQATVPGKNLKKKKKKQEIKDNENVENLHERSNDYGKDNSNVKNLHAKSNDDSIVEVLATGETHEELATLEKKKHEQEITDDKNVENLQAKSNDDSIVDVAATGEPHGEAADPGKKLKKKKKPKQEVKDNENMENLHGKSNNDLIMEVRAAGEPDREVVAQRKKVKKKKKKKIEEKNLDAKSNDGLIIEVLAAGEPDGEVAAPGKKVEIFYTVRLKGSRSVIDSNVGGKPLKYYIGDEKVVKGWSIGVDGMHVGEKRRVSFPPSMGYGKRFVEVIPENSWVEGDIELVNVC